MCAVSILDMFLVVELIHNTFFLQVVLGIVQFFVVVGASLIIGTVIGCLGVLMTKYSEHVHGEQDQHLERFTY